MPGWLHQAHGARQACRRPLPPWRPPAPSANLCVPASNAARQITANSSPAECHRRPPALCQLVIGGTNINSERGRLSRGRCDVLVATPGRLQDHIESTDGFAGRLWGVQVCTRLGFGRREAMAAQLR